MNRNFNERYDMKEIVYKPGQMNTKNRKVLWDPLWTTLS